MHKIQVIVAVVAGLAFANAYGKATLVNNTWRKADNTFDGCVTNAAHWEKGHVPTALERMYSWNREADFTVTFPEGAYTNQAAFRFAPANGREVTVDGSNTTWVMAGSDDGTTEVHDDDPFRIYGNNEIGLMNMSVGTNVASLAASVYSHTMAELTNFRFTITGSAADPSLALDGGTYDFRDPAGAEWTTTAKPLLILCSSEKATGTSRVTFRNGASLRAWDVGFQTGGVLGGCLTFDGGNHYTENFDIPNGNVGYANGLANAAYMTLTNGAVLSTGNFKNGFRANKTTKLLLTGAGTKLNVRGQLDSASGAGVSYVDVLDGAELRVEGAANFLSGGGTNYARIVNGKLTSAGKRAVDGSKVTWTSPITIGSVSGAGKVAGSKCVFAATNATVATESELNVEHVADVTVAGADSKWDVGALNLYKGNKYPGAEPRMRVAGGAFVVSNDVVISSFGSSELEVAGGTFTAAAYVNIGNNSGSDGTLTVSGGVFDNDFSQAESFSPSKVACCTYLSKASDTAMGTINVTGGHAKFYQIYAGWAGPSAINVSGGKLSLRTDLRLGNKAGHQNVMTQTGGEVYAPINVNIGQAAGAFATLKLNGGTFTCKSLQAYKASTLHPQGSGNGSATLEADGGTLVAYADSANFVRYFNTAEIKAGGLTIDTAGHAVTLDQNFTGTGTLTLTGGGTVTFAADKTVEGPVKVVGGTQVVFNGLVPNGLTLGDADGAAVLALAAGTAVAVNGDLALNNVNLSISGLTVGTTSEVFTVTGALSEGTAAKWAAIEVAGVPSTAAYESEIVETEGTKRLRLVVREPLDITVATPAGTTETHATNIAWKVNDRMHFDVGNGGTMVTTGELGKGWLYKEGEGTLTLANPISGIFNGVKFRDGTLNFDYPTEPAVTDWSLWLDSQDELGTNELRFTSTKDVRIKDLCAKSADAAKGSVVVATAGQVAFDVSASVSSYVTGSIEVEEGEAAIRGTYENVKEIRFNQLADDLAAVMVGNKGKGGTRSTKAGLVVDHMLVNGSISMCQGNSKTDPLGDDNPVQETYLVLTNGAVLTGTGSAFVNCTSKDMRMTIALDNSELRGSWEYNQYGKPTVPPKVTARNGSKISGTAFFRGDSEFVFDGSQFTGSILYYANHWYTNSFTFANGSVCNPPEIRSGWTGAYKTPATIFLTFDDSEFTGLGGDFGPHDPHLKPEEPELASVNPTVRVFAKGVGLKLNVPTDSTYTWSYSLADSAEGAGGFVKKGEGTLKVCKVRNPDMTVADAFSFAQTGRTVVEAGTLDLDGNTWANATIAGAGTVANGTLADAKIAIVGGAVPTFAASCAFDGKVIVDLDGAGLRVGTKVTVAKYAGSAPDVSKWRLVNNNERTKGTFEAKDGKVVATIINRSGLVVVAW